MTRLGPPAVTGRAIARRAPTVDPVRAAAAVATAYVEVRGGRRPLPQLRDVLTWEAYRRAQRTVRAHRDPVGAGGATSVCHVTACWPTPHAVEVTVIVRDGARVVPVAVRLDCHDARWGITDIGLPHERAVV